MRLLIFVTLYCLASVASATTGMMDDLITKTQAASSGWMTNALEYAKNLFFGLAAIEFAWSSIQLTLKKSELSEIMVGTLFKVMSLSFFAMILIKAPEWIPPIINSFKVAGAGVGGAPNISPSNVFDLGLGLAADLLQFSSDSAPSAGGMFINSLTGSGQGLGKYMLSSIIVGIASVFIVLGYGLIAVQLLITLIESYIIIGGGAIMLGFSGSRWTHNLAEKYFGYAISVGVKLFTIYLIIGFGESFTQAMKDVIAQAYAASPENGPSFGDYLGIGGASLLYGATGYMVPGLAGSMLNGSVSMSLQNTGAAAGMVGGAPVAGTLSAGAAGARAVGLAAAGVGALLPVQKAAGAIAGSSSNGGFGLGGAGISGEKPGMGGGITGFTNNQKGGFGGGSNGAPGVTGNGNNFPGGSPSKGGFNNTNNGLPENLSSNNNGFDSAPNSASNPQPAFKSEATGTETSNTSVNSSNAGNNSADIEAAKIFANTNPGAPKTGKEISDFASTLSERTAPTPTNSSPGGEKPAFVDPNFDPSASPRSSNQTQDEKGRAYRNETGGLSSNEAPPQKSQRFDRPENQQSRTKSTADKFNNFARNLQRVANSRSPHLVNDGTTGSAHGLRIGQGD